MEEIEKPCPEKFRVELENQLASIMLDLYDGVPLAAEENIETYSHIEALMSGSGEACFRVTAIQLSLEGIRQRTFVLVDFDTADFYGLMLDEETAHTYPISESTAIFIINKALEQGQLQSQNS